MKWPFAAANPASSSGWSQWCLYGALPLAIALTTAWLFRHVFHSAPITTDENSYVFQAYNFLAGVVARPLPLIPNIFYHEMIIQDDAAGWLSRYPPGHPLWLLPGCLFNYPHVMVALAAGLSVWLMARTGALFGQREAWVAAVLLALSPFFLFTHGTLLSHTSGMLAALLLLYGFLRWQLTGGIGFAALAGLGWSWLFLNRTYTAMWLAIPFGVYALWRLWQGRRKKSHWWDTMLFAVTAISGIIAMLFYNKLSTGDARLMTYLLYDPSEGPGFGLKHLSGVAGVHTLSHGLGFLWSNLKLLDLWLFGFAGSLLITFTLALLGWRTRWTPLLLAGPLLVWTGYVGYFYPGPQETGPGYYLETLPFLLLAAALGVTRLLDWLRTHMRRWLVIVLPVCACCSAANICFMYSRGQQLSIFNRRIGDILTCIRAAPKNALVFATEEGNPYAGLHHGLSIFNPQGLDSQPLVVRSLGPGDQLLCRLFPDRKPFRLQAIGTLRLEPFAKIPYFEQRSCINVHSRTGIRDLGGTQHDQWQLMAKAGQHREEFLAFGDEFIVFPGRLVIGFDISISNAPPAQPSVTLDIAMNGGHTILASCNLTGTVARLPELSFTIPREGRVEPRVYYHGVGDVIFRGFLLREQSTETATNANLAPPP